MHSKQYLIEVCTIAGQIDPTAIERMAMELVALRKRRGRLFIIGLGGSAANASHAVNDFRKLCGIESYAPTDNVAELTARANDEGWERIFTDWLRPSRFGPSDALFILSVGGGAHNVSLPICHAMSFAKVHVGASVYGIVGRDGGMTKEYADCCIIIPTVKDSRVTPHTEAFQSVILHCLVSHPDLQIKATKW